MHAYFVDSSALVKRYRSEAGSQRATDLLQAAERLVASRLTQVEVSAAIIRRSRHGRVSEEELSRTLEMVDCDLRDSFDIVELDTPVIETALALTRKHRLRAADALQLACAVLVGHQAPSQDLILMGSDEELNAAATVEGLAVLDPTR